MADPPAEPTEEAPPPVVFRKKKRKKHHANDDEDHMINIHILQEDGSKVLKRPIRMHPRRRVEHLFQKVGQLLGAAPLRQRMFFNGKELEPQLCLEDAITDPDGHHVENCAVTLEIDEESRYILSGSVDRTAVIWSVDTGEQIRVFKAHINCINTAVFNSDGSMIATAGDDHNVRVWSALTGKCMHQLNNMDGHAWPVNSAAFSADDALMATASADKTIKVWKYAKELCIKTLTGHTKSVSSAVFSSDGHVVLSASHDRTAALWLWEEGERTLTFNGHKDIVFSAIFSPDEASVLTASGDRTARMWSAERPQGPGPPFPHQTADCLRIFRGDHRGCVISANFCHGCESVITVCEDHVSARIFNVETGDYGPVCKDNRPPPKRTGPGIPAWESGPRPHGNFTNPVGPFNSAATAWDGKSLVAASIDRTAKLFDTETGELIRTFRGHGGGVVAVNWMPETIPTIDEPAESEPEDKELHIHLDASSGESHGLDAQSDVTGKRLLINSIAPGGLAAEWNQKHPFELVAPGDFILCINGIEDESELMMAELNEDRLLEVTLLREVCFDIIIEAVFDTSEYEEWGMEFSDADERLRVDCIFGDLGEKYNKKIAADDKTDDKYQIQPGDFIIEVNGVGNDCNLLRKELQEGMKELCVKFLREAPKDLCWDVVLELGEDESVLGMGLSVQADQKMLIIEFINDSDGKTKSLIEAWNIGNPTMQVLAGDKIFEVNDIRHRGKQMLDVLVPSGAEPEAEAAVPDAEGAADSAAENADAAGVAAAVSADAEAAGAGAAPDAEGAAVLAAAPDAGAAEAGAEDGEGGGDAGAEGTVEAPPEQKKFKLKIYRQVIFEEESEVADEDVHTPHSSHENTDDDELDEDEDEADGAGEETAPSVDKANKPLEDTEANKPE